MYGNYYNPYLQQQPQYQMPQYQQPQYQAPQATQPQLARIVSDFNEITIGDIPTNGTTAYFIKAMVQKYRLANGAKMEEL